MAGARPTGLAFRLPSLAATLTAALITAASAAECVPPRSAPLRIDSLPDLRTVALEDGRRLRIAGIEPVAVLAPERPSDQDLAAARALLEGRSATLRLLGPRSDRHGRRAAELFLDDRPIAVILAEAGLVLAMPAGRDPSCLRQILQAEERARAARIGAWAALPATLPAADERVLGPLIGAFAIFEGQVISVGLRRSRIYLNFGRRWSSDVTVEIDRKDEAAFGGAEALAALEGGRVRVRGFVDERNGPVIVARSPLQIETIEAPPERNGNEP